MTKRRLVGKETECLHLPASKKPRLTSTFMDELNDIKYINASQNSNVNNLSQLSFDVNPIYNENNVFSIELIPHDLLIKILSYLNAIEWITKGISMVNNSLYNECWNLWKNQTNIIITPDLIPCILKDFDAEYMDHESNKYLSKVIQKFLICGNVRSLVLDKLMINNAMFTGLLNVFKDIVSLRISDTPNIFTNLWNNWMNDTPTILRNLRELTICHMYPNFDDNILHYLLQNCHEKLIKFEFYRKNPFKCSNTTCNKTSLSKYLKCAVCELRVYCSDKCQCYDWNIMNHQYICSYHSAYINKKSYENNLISFNIISLISKFKNLIHLNLSYNFMLNIKKTNYDSTSFNIIFQNCVKIRYLYLNGCNINNAQINDCIKYLKELTVFETNMSRYINTSSILSIKNSKYIKKYLIHINIDRCWKISYNDVIILLNNLNANIVKHLGIACGIKQGGYIWYINNKMIYNILRYINLEYLSIVHNNNDNNNNIVNLSLLINIKNIQLFMLKSKKCVTKNIDTGRFNVISDNSSNKNTPLLIEKYINGIRIQKQYCKR